MNKSTDHGFNVTGYNNLDARQNALKKCKYIHAAI